MKRLYLLAVVSVIFLSACTKRDYLPPPNDSYEWMRTHEKGVVAYVDDYTGNYIVETYRGYAVVEPWDSYSPMEYDEEYAYFSSRGLQTVYNWNGDYFTKGRVVDTYLSWSQAMYIIDQMSYE